MRNGQLAFRRIHDKAGNGKQSVGNCLYCERRKRLSQEEIAIRLNVVRQTVSKWERGLSVPDSGMLISLADELDTSVSILLGESMQETCPDERDMQCISEKLKVLKNVVYYFGQIKKGARRSGDRKGVC